MKLDLFGKRLAKVAYHVMGVLLIIVPFIDTDPINITVDAFLFMFFFALCHFTELDKK